MSLNPKELKVVGNKVSYQGLIVATINDMDMSRQRFEFEDFLKNTAGCKNYEKELEDAYDEGYEEGFRKGAEQGYDEGFDAAKAATNE